VLKLVGFALALALAAAFFVQRQWVPSVPARGYAHPSGMVAHGYFPPALTRATYKCAEFPKPVPLVSAQEVDWFSEQLLAADEPSILPALASGTNVYRFTWLRSFDPPVMIRIEEAGGGEFLMTASRLSGKGGYEPGEVEARVRRKLTTGEVSQFQRALLSANRLRLKAVSCGNGYDGALWIMEAVDRGAYRYVNRWSPHRGPVRALGMVMLSFTGWTPGPVY
jgi:hypothetical protein